MVSPPEGPLFEKCQFRHQGQSKLQDRNPAVSATEPGWN